MPASYPSSVKTFTTKTTGQVIEASHVNELQDEVTAVETGLLQGLAHNLFPDTDAGRDLGTLARRWRELLSQKVTLGLTAATRFRIQEVGTSTWLTVNASYDGTNWNREDTAQPAQAIEINSAKEVKYYRAAAGSNPITWSPVFTVSTDRVTAGQAVFGTDPGGTEKLRAQNLRAGTTTLTGTLTAPTAIIGTDPGGTEVLRAENLKAGTTSLGATTLSGNLTAPSAVIGSDPGGTETLRAQNLRAGATVLTGNLTAPSAIVGTDPGGTEKLRAENFRAGATTLTGNLTAPSAVIGTDPGGSEVLRAASARATTLWVSDLPGYGWNPSARPVLTVSEATYGDKNAWSAAALQNLFATATNIVVETSDDGTTWTTGNPDDFRRIVRGVEVTFTRQYVRFTCDVSPSAMAVHLILILSYGTTNLTRVLRVEVSNDGGNTWGTRINNASFSGGEQRRVFPMSFPILDKVRITLWATTWPAGSRHVLLWLCGTTHYPFRYGNNAGPRLGQPDGSTRTALFTPSDVLPTSDNTVDCGNAALRWRETRAVTGVFGTDPGGTERLRAENLRAGVTTLTGNLTAPTAVIGTAPSGTEKLRTENLRAGTTVLTGNLTAPSAVVGTDPGGTEALRAGSARLNAPVLLGSVPQFTLAADPTSALQVATKQYVDNRYPRIINDVTLSSATTSVTINMGETLNDNTPLLIVGECRFNSTNTSQVFMRVNGDTNNNYSSVWYGSASGSEIATNAARVVPVADNIRSCFVMYATPPWGLHRLFAAQWTTGLPAGGCSHQQWSSSATISSLTFFVDTGSFVANTRFVIWRLAP